MTSPSPPRADRDPRWPVILSLDSWDKTDAGVCAVTCVLVRAGYRKRGIAYALAAAAIDHARSRGVRALEAYPMRTDAGQITWDEVHVGAQSIFAAAGMTEVSRPGKRRIVMRIDFGDDGAPDRAPGAGRLPVALRDDSAPRRSVGADPEHSGSIIRTHGGAA
jgi:predicted GNAT family acetyltransferase